MEDPETQHDSPFGSHSDSPTIEQLILNRLDAASLSGTAKILVLAALLSDEEFASVLGGGDHTPRRPETSTVVSTGQPVGTYLDRIEVTGFRGIGPTATLNLHPGPGLTIVTGRNGSGKSSFAEAAEFALTGDNKRWAGRTSVWQEGWRNLHAGEPRIAVHLGVEGQRNGATVECHWPEGGKLGDAASFLQVTGQKRQRPADLGWSRALELYRPFLSYAELGGLLSGKPSEMHDSLYRILGLDRLVEVETLLKGARKRMDDQRKVADAALPRLQTALAAHADPRARRAETHLAAGDLDALELLAGTDIDAVDDGVGPLRQLDAVELPQVTTVTAIVERLRAAMEKIKIMVGTPAEEARAIAGLLRDALAHYGKHPDEPCPVCAGRTLDTVWARSAQIELDRLTERGRELDSAHQDVRESLRALRLAVPPAPATLNADLAGDGIDCAEARARWQQWDNLLASAEPSQVADLAPIAYDQLVGAFEPIRAAAGVALAKRAQAWQPLAEQIRAWVGTARDSDHAKKMHAALQAAIGWMKNVSDDIRNAQLKPVADAATDIWNTLRQESNVDLGTIRLAGTGPSRRIDLNVNVDGVAGAALGVMSQGELHALALALFLPRATMPESPFRFLVIDDPVQSMDPAKVYGLATVLEQVAKQRQVIVFTHDDRLPAAVRQLQIDARIVTVNRRAGSIVAVATAQEGNPAWRYLSDAHAITKDDSMTDDVRGVIVAGLVRDAIECTCHEVIRRRDFRAGVPITDTERVISAAGRTKAILGLALKEAGDASELAMKRLHPDTPWVVKFANRGAHGEAILNSADLVRAARDVVKSLEKL